MFTNWKEFLIWEKNTKDTIDVKKTYIDIAGDFMAGVLLSQIIYWYLPNKEGRTKLRVKKENHYWIAKKISDWYDEIRFSRRNYETAIKKLEKKNLVIKKVFKFNNETMTHIRLNIPVFLSELNALLKQQQANLKQDDFDDFDAYITKMTEPLENMGMSDLYIPECTNRTFPECTNQTFQERTNQTFQNAHFEHSKMHDPSKPITKSTSENTPEINNDVCEEEKEILSTLEKREDIKPHTHTEIINLLASVKKKKNFKYSIFLDTLNKIDFDIHDINYFKRALTNNLKEGRVRTAAGFSPKYIIRKEIIPDWFDKNEPKSASNEEIEEVEAIEGKRNKENIPNNKERIEKLEKRLENIERQKYEKLDTVELKIKLEIFEEKLKNDTSDKEKKIIERDIRIISQILEERKRATC